MFEQFEAWKDDFDDFSTDWINVDGYFITENLGQHYSSKVYKGYKVQHPSEVVAIKCIERTAMAYGSFKAFLTELNWFIRLKNDYLVSVNEVQWDSRYIYIIMEYCDGGNLAKILQNDKKLSESRVRKLFGHIAAGMEYLNSHDITHFALKPENILIVTKPLLRAKIGDYGLVCFLTENEWKKHLKAFPQYMGPEMILRNHYDRRADLWAFGVMVYESLFGEPPYKLPPKSKQLREVIQSERIHVSTKDVTPECRRLLLGLLQPNVDKRFTHKEFFNDPFLDLEHLPNAKNYSKGLLLIFEAVSQDSNNNLKEAFYLYCNALKYFVPLVKTELNQEYKDKLRNKVVTYLRRCEELKTAFYEIPTFTLNSEEGSKISVSRFVANENPDDFNLVNEQPYIRTEKSNGSQDRYISNISQNINTAKREITFSYNSSSTNLQSQERLNSSDMCGEKELDISIKASKSDETIASVSSITLPQAIEMGFQGQMHLAMGEYSQAVQMLGKCLVWLESHLRDPLGPTVCLQEKLSQWSQLKDCAMILEDSDI